ncbi:hypothetical protein ACWJJH_07035 [Endozoicomonadaceae bacterium StTr2]
MIIDLIRTVVSKLRSLPDLLTSEQMSGRVKIEPVRKQETSQPETPATTSAEEPERVVVARQEVEVVEDKLSNLPETDSTVEKPESENVSEPSVLSEQTSVENNTEVTLEKAVDSSSLEFAADAGQELPSDITADSLVLQVIEQDKATFGSYKVLVKPLATLLKQDPTVAQVLEVNGDDFQQLRGIGAARVKALHQLQELLKAKLT